ncbi:hypothetical protein NQ318_003162 [Aromia moschata]|uniref:DUF4817 domain-containing protein n=1 Tax=Aromia moschata TaxID=1265417 RepID=A0AAV8XI17_9CUCU|nr:hypothetical protein NQ318_003162 [Aromia moschata]
MAPELQKFLRCGDKTGTQKQACEIFNTKYPDRRISRSTCVAAALNLNVSTVNSIPQKSRNDELLKSSRKRNPIKRIDFHEDNDTSKFLKISK